MELLERQIKYAVQILITTAVILICGLQIYKDGSNVAAWSLLSGTIAYWFPNPKL